MVSFLFAKIDSFFEETESISCIYRAPHDLRGHWSSLDQQGAGLTPGGPGGFAKPRVEKITMLFRTNQVTGPAIDLFRQASLVSIGQ